MPTNENVRLRIRQYLIELMDEEAADAMMESMPPTAWSELATKADIDRLDGRVDSMHTGLSARIDELGDRMNTRIDGLTERMDSLADRLDARVDGIGQRMDDMAERMDSLARSVTFGAVTISLTLLVFMVGTMVSLIIAGG